MAIRFLLRDIKNPINGKTKTYAQIAEVEYTMLDTIVERIVEQSSLSAGDVLSVLEMLKENIVEELSHGNSVRLGDLGSFRPAITSQGMEPGTAKRYPAALIKNFKIRYTPSGYMRRAFNKNQLTFHQVKKEVRDNNGQNESPEAES